MRMVLRPECEKIARQAMWTGENLLRMRGWGEDIKRMLEEAKRSGRREVYEKLLRDNIEAVGDEEDRFLGLIEKVVRCECER